jgi:hypothetical protein
MDLGFKGTFSHRTICRTRGDVPTSDPVAHLLIPALIALFPAAFAVWTGRRLLDLADDPAFAERLLVQRTRSGVVSGLCVVLLMALAWDHFVWELALLMATRMAVGYRIRKALYRETWSFGAYISFFSRLTVASFGFWVALGAMPTIAMMAHSRDWMLASKPGPADSSHSGGGGNGAGAARREYDIYRYG